MFAVGLGRARKFTIFVSRCTGIGILGNWEALAYSLGQH